MSRIEKVLIVLAIMAYALFASAALALAQVHPCDTTLLNTEVRPNAPFAIGACHNGQDADGLPVTIDSWRITIDGATVYTGAMTKSATPNAQGYYYYESPKTLNAAKGSHTVVIYAVSNDGGEGAPSNPVTLTSKPGSPKKSEAVRAVR